MLNEWGKGGRIFFDGDDIAKVGWQIVEIDGNHMWWSGEGNLKNFVMMREIDLRGVESATLMFFTYWDIEPYWDFGFVQVSTDGGKTWISLENPDTTYEHDPSAHPAIVANLPGFTGCSETWKVERFDLSPYTGQVILLAFRYMTDWAVAYPGWYIDNIMIPEIGFFDNVEAGMNGWIVEYPETDFTVTVIYAFVRGSSVIYQVVVDMRVKSATEEGHIIQPLRKPSYVIVIVSYTGLEGFVDYTFWANPFRG